MINYIGSVAIKHWYPDFTREPNDIDILHKDNASYLSTKGNHRQIIIDGKLKRIEDHYIPALSKYMIEYDGYLHPNILLTLKVSHIFWDIFWDKTMWDIQFLLKKGHKIMPNLFCELYEYWNTVHTKNVRSKLDMTAEDFFDNALTCEYSHDWLHTLIQDYPTFNKVLKDGAEVEVDESKFNNLTFEDKCNLVTEEVMIMAYERYGNMDYRRAYGRMLKKFIMNHAPIWEALFIIKNYNILYRPNFNYINHINNKIKENGTNIVKRIQ